MLRRHFIKTASLSMGTFLKAKSAQGLSTVSYAAQVDESSGSPEMLRSAIAIGDHFVSWQSPYGSVDPSVCPYRTAGRLSSGIQGLGPGVRALYKLYVKTKKVAYKAAADRYASYVMGIVVDPPTPYSNKFIENEHPYTSLSAAWMYGKALSPCFEWFVRMNPQEGAYDQKAYAMYRWLQLHRRMDSYFGVGYPAGKYPDAQFSCDLGEVGTGLVGLYRTTHYRAALEDAIGLAKFFLTDYREGTGEGVWSPDLGVWLVGPWPGSEAEHFTTQQYNTAGWVWSAFVDSEFLLRLREEISDTVLKARIDEKCVRAFRWCIDSCQFDDGAIGMFGRDDKWVGLTASVISLYLMLGNSGSMSEEVASAYRPKVANAWKWLLAHTLPETYPQDGYIYVTGRTTTKPPENLMWLMAWTIEALLEAPETF